MTNTEMTYSQSAKGVTITHERALVELRKHGIDTSEDSEDLADFHEMCGERQAYDAGKVLEYLGY